MIDWTKPLKVVDRETGKSFPVLCWAKLINPMGEFTTLAAWMEGVGMPECRLFDDSGNGAFYRIENL